MYVVDKYRARSADLYTRYKSIDFRLRFVFHEMTIICGIYVGINITSYRCDGDARNGVSTYGLMYNEWCGNKNGSPSSQIVTDWQRTTARTHTRAHTRPTRDWSTYAHRTVNLLAPNIRPNDRAAPIYRLTRILRNICKTPDTRNPNSRLDAIRWELHLEFHKSSLKAQHNIWLSS